MAPTSTTKKKRARVSGAPRVSSEPPPAQNHTLTQLWPGVSASSDVDAHDAAAAVEDELLLDLEDDELEMFTQGLQLSQASDVQDAVDDLLDENESEDDVVVLKEGVGEGSSATNPFVDTPDKVYLSEGRTLRIFKKGETRTSMSSCGAESKTVYYFLHRFRTRELCKEAVCSTFVFIDLVHTFIGPAEGMLLCRDDNWKLLHPDENTRGMARVANPNQTGLSTKGAVPLRGLHGLCQRFPIHKPPDPNIYYECETKTTKGVGFDVAYRLGQGQLQLTDPLHQRQQIRIPIRQKPVVLELFAGASGVGLGFNRAGLHVKYLVEISPHAAATLRCNEKFHPDGCMVYEEDVNQFLSKAKAEDPCYPLLGAIDHIHASPPCQGFSKANRNGGKNDVENNKLTFSFVEAVKYFRPGTASLENVTGMLDERDKSNNGDHDLTKNLHYLQRVVRELLALGYQVRVTVLDASDYGDAQTRKRVVLFAARYDYHLPKRPMTTHGIVDEKPKTTNRDVLQDLQNVAPVPGSGLVKLPNGQIVTDHNVEGTILGDIPAETSIAELQSEKQAGTLLRQRPVQHYALERYLTVRERARLQGFPDAYQFCGTLAARRDQIGNAVPVGLATAMGRSIMASHQQHMQ